MGGVICNSNDRKKQESNEDNENIKDTSQIIISQNVELSKSISKNGFSKKESEKILKKDKKFLNKVTIDTNLLVSEGQNNIKTNYKKTKVLGKGSFGVVYLVKQRQLNTYYAMKVLKKADNKEENEDILMNEINILRKIDHPNIVKINDFYITNTEYIIITEYCSEGELFYEIKNNAPFNEALAGWYMKQILSAVNYCHKLKIIHRDLKPENILISKKAKNGFNIIKIIDFGTAIFFNKKNDKKLTGSIYYISPEVISQKRNYTEKCDVWSCGIIMYILLTGKPPFNGDSDESIMRKILKGKFNMDRYPWPIISSEAKDLIKKLLEFEAHKRLTAEEALKHPWFECKEVKSEKSDGLFKVKNPNKLLNNLMNFKNDNILRSAVFAYLIHNNIQLNIVHEAIKLFNKMDKDGNGIITKDELYKGFENYLALSGKDLKKKVDIIFSNIDTDHDGFIEYEEFIKAAVDKEYFLSETFLKFAFDYFDRDRNGQISYNEIKELFLQAEKNKNNKEAQSQILKSFEDTDINRDGVLSFEEFVKMARKIIKKE